MFCKKCGKNIADNAVFCPECGEKVEHSVSDSRRTHKSLWIIACLAIALIVFGIQFFARNHGGRTEKSPASVSTPESLVTGKTASKAGKVYIPKMEALGNGRAVAIYKGSSDKNVNIQALLQEEKKQFIDNGGYLINQVEKLPTTLEYLIGEALSEYEFEKGEVYVVFARPYSNFGYDDEHGFCFCVVVDDKSSNIPDYFTPSFRYIGFSYDFN